MSEIVRLSVNLHQTVAAQFRALVARDGISVTEGVRRAIGAWKVIADAQAAGGTVCIRYRDGNWTEITIITGPDQVAS